MIRKYMLPILAVFGVMFAIFIVIRGNRPIPAAQPIVNPAAPPFTSSVAGAGIVEANTENISIGTLVSGVVSEVYVSVGSKIRAGDALFKLDDRDLLAQLSVRQMALRVADANVKVAKASLADLKNQLYRAKILSDKEVISIDEFDRRSYAVQTAIARLNQARAEVVSVKAQIGEIRTNLDRIIVRTPVDGEALQVKIHPGEFALAGVTQTPLMILGNIEPKYVRVDVDENDAWRVHPTVPAIAFLRGNREIKTPLAFVRFEPYVVPKKSLTGDSTERVDTRVLQVIYRIEDSSIPVFVGQQMDVFIEATHLQFSDPSLTHLLP